MSLDTTISPDQLANLVGTPDCPVLVDLRIDEDFDESPSLIPTSFRRDFRTAQDWSTALPAGPVVVICHKGRKISQGVAALLRCDGRNAASLAGGNVAWAKQGLPVMPATRLPTSTGGEPTLWVTGFGVGIDTTACAWLVRRFVDRNARFLFVDEVEVADVEDRFGATAFGTAGSNSHFRTFHNMLERFTLSSSGLDYLGRMIACAENSAPATTPEAPGLAAAFNGIAAAHASDLDRLDAGIALLDAFYAWSRSARRPS